MPLIVDLLIKLSSHNAFIPQPGYEILTYNTNNDTVLIFNYNMS